MFTTRYFSSPLPDRRSLAAILRFPFALQVSDRLKDLQRQRALAREQLAWLDREIARESAPSAPGPPAAPSPTPAPAAGPAAPAASAQAAAEAEAILAQYKSDPSALQKKVKRGCYLYFVAAFGLLGLGVLAFYFLRRPA
jgi:uncharacterized membrane protein